LSNCRRHYQENFKLELLGIFELFAADTNFSVPFFFLFPFPFLSSLHFFFSSPRFSRFSFLFRGGFFPRI